MISPYEEAMMQDDVTRWSVKWRALDQTIAEARSKFADMPAVELEAAIGEAVAAVRAPHARKLG
jgi:hypothetical protein